MSRSQNTDCSIKRKQIFPSFDRFPEGYKVPELYRKLRGACRKNFHQVSSKSEATSPHTFNKQNFINNVGGVINCTWGLAGAGQIGTRALSNIAYGAAHVARAVSLGMLFAALAKSTVERKGDFDPLHVNRHLLLLNTPPPPARPPPAAGPHPPPPSPAWGANKTVLRFVV